MQDGYREIHLAMRSQHRPLRNYVAQDLEGIQATKGSGLGAAL